MAAGRTSIKSRRMSFGGQMRTMVLIIVALLLSSQTSAGESSKLVSPRQIESASHRARLPFLPRRGRLDTKLSLPLSRGDQEVGLKKATRIGINLFLWWTLNVVFNLCNKQCLNSWPHPWALATSHLAIGSSCMLPLYLPLPHRMKESGSYEWQAMRAVPNLGLKEFRLLLPVIALLCIGHLTSTLAPAFGSVAFSNIIKTAEPLFTCAISYILYRRTFSAQVYAALLLVVSGVALFSTYDLDFSVLTLAAGMISNAAYALYSIRAKSVLQQLPQLTTRNMYAVLTIGGCLVLAPVSLFMELTGAGASRFAKGTQAVSGLRLVALLIFTGLLQYMSNEIAFCTLSMIHPVTYAVANTFKRSIVVAASLFFFGQHLPASGVAGAAMAIMGALLYSLEMSSSVGKAYKTAAEK